MFLLYGYPPFYYDIMVLNSSHFSFYKFCTFSVYAVEKSNFNEDELRQLKWNPVAGLFCKQHQGYTLRYGTWGELWYCKRGKPTQWSVDRVRDNLSEPDTYGD